MRNENVRSSSANSPEASSSSISPKQPKGKSSSEQQPLEKAVKDPPKSPSLTTSTNSQGESAQGGSETCSLCNEPDLLFEPNGANLEPRDCPAFIASILDVLLFP